MMNCVVIFFGRLVEDGFKVDVGWDISYFFFLDIK